jgi:SPP1 family phage portal protein
MRSFTEICRDLGGEFSAQGVIGDKRPTDLQILEWELKRWLGSENRRRMLEGQAYYEGKQDILRQRRMVIGRGGELEPVRNLPDNKLVNNQYGKLVNQKTDYMLGQPISWEVENADFSEELKGVFDRRFLRQLKRLGKDCYNHGIAWLYPYINAQGGLGFRRFPGYEILPFWLDAEHTALECALRFYMVEKWENGRMTPAYKAEVFDLAGVHRFDWVNGRLIPEDNCHFPYMKHVLPNGELESVNWTKIPLIPFKLNERELPLISRVKCLQDALNQMLSRFQNALEEDAHNTVLVIKNYDGTDLDEFRHNLAAYGAVKVKTVDGGGGGIETLSIDVNADNYESILDVLKDAIIENGMGFDSKLDKSYRTTNELNIKSMYSDICLDGNDFETEWQASFEELLWFVQCYLANVGHGDFVGESWRLIFNRDIMIDESEVIENCQKSLGVISDRSIVAQHPWVNDVQGELERLRQQKAASEAEAQSGKSGEA